MHRFSVVWRFINRNFAWFTKIASIEKNPLEKAPCFG
jgi:hypothetical protein